MTAFGTVTWGSAPGIPITFSYEHRRSGADMQYRVTVEVAPVTGNRYFGFPIYLEVAMDGVRQLSATMKNAYPDRWSSPISYTSAWYTLEKKTTGTTAMAFRVYSGLGSARDETYTYQATVDPAASTMTVGDGTLGKAQTVAVQQNDTTFTHTLTYICGDSSGTVCSKSAQTSLSWTPPLSLAAENTAGERVSITLTLTTYSGATEVGSQQKTVTAAIPETVVPRVEIRLTDPTGNLARYGSYVQSKSKLQVEVTAEAAYGARITALQAAANGTAYTTDTFTTDGLRSSGSQTVTVTVTDARGRKATATASYTALPYSPPTVTVRAVRRCNQEGSYTGAGDYLRVDFDASAASLEGSNTTAFSLRYQKTGGFWESMRLTDYDGRFSVTGGHGIFPAETGSSYSVELEITDAFTTSTAAGSGSSVAKFMSWLKKGLGIAFGKVAEEAHTLDSAWVIRARQGIQIPDGAGGFRGVAPDGFGLGVNARDLPDYDANNARGNGWYRAKVNTPDDDWWYGCHMDLNDNYINAVQRFYRQGDNYEARRVKVNGVWGTWEWVTPPLKEGVEYPTTERFNGSVVYKKRVSFGALPNAAAKTVAHGCGVSADQFVSITGMAASAYEAIPLTFGMNGTLGGYVYVNNTNVAIRTMTNCSDYNAWVLLSYIKK